MEEIFRGRLPLLRFRSLERLGMVEHCFTTRHGGVSTGCFSSLNLSFTRGDDNEAVRENFRRVAEALGAPEDRFVFTWQSHTTNVGVVYDEDAGKGLTRERDYRDVDGLVTNVPGLVLSTFFADCVPLYFVDPVNKAIGLAHSGWRGTVKRMGERMVEVMEECFGSDPSDIYAAIGPSICQNCYEVGDEVAREFADAFPQDQRVLLRRGREGHWWLDLWYANQIVLTDAGIPFDHIELASMCTSCNSRVLFSHRATGGKRGNLGAFMYIR